MKLSVLIAQGTDGWKIAKRAEQLGLHAAWFEDSQMCAADPVVSIAVTAQHTSRIRLGTGILVPSNRIAPQTANSFASLNAFAPGRINLGIGTGFSARRAMGLSPVKIEDMREYVRIIEALLHGEITEWEFEGERRKIAFVNADQDIINLTDPIDIYIGANGPKMRRLTAETKTHWMNIYVSLEQAAETFKDMERQRIEMGTSPADFKNAMFFTGSYPLAEGESLTSERCLRQAGPLAAVLLHNVIEMAQHGTLGSYTGVDKAILDKCMRLYESYQPADARYLALHRGHALFLREDEAEFMTPDWIRHTTMTAPVAEIREHIRELLRIGYQEIVFMMNTYHPEDINVIERWVEVMEGV